MLSIKAPLFAVLLVSLVCAENTYYTIWPKDSSDTATNKAITDELNLKVGTKNIYASESATIGFLFWYQQLSSDLVDHFSKWPGVRYVSPPCNQPQPGTNLNQGACGIHYRAVDSSPTRASLVKRGAQTTQPNSPDQLKVLSQAKGQTLGDVKGYTYDDTAGQDVRVYIIDSGANTGHEDLKNTDFTWMFPGPNPLTGQKNDAGLDSHGTCMASMVGGIALGTAKKAKITLLKVPFNEDQEAWTVERTVDALAMVYDDIMLNELQGKAIVSMSWGISNNLNQQYVDAFSAAYKYLIDALLKVDVYPVIAAGQDNSADTDAPINHYPALLGKDEPRITVVGAVDNKGNPFEGGFYDPNIVKVSGPGDHLQCANRDGGYDYTVDGSSAPTAMTAGLMADFITGINGKSMTPVEAQNHLYDKTWARVDNGRKVIYYSFDRSGEEDDAGAASVDAPAPAPPRNG